jgi:hypothetical protein
MSRAATLPKCLVLLGPLLVEPVHALIGPSDTVFPYVVDGSGLPGYKLGTCVDVTNKGPKAYVEIRSYRPDGRAWEIQLGGSRGALFSQTLASGATFSACTPGTGDRREGYLALSSTSNLSAYATYFSNFAGQPVISTPPSPVMTTGTFRASALGNPDSYKTLDDYLALSHTSFSCVNPNNYAITLRFQLYDMTGKFLQDIWLFLPANTQVIDSLYKKTGLTNYDGSVLASATDAGSKPASFGCYVLALRNGGYANIPVSSGPVADGTTKLTLYERTLDGLPSQLPATLRVGIKGTESTLILRPDREGKAGAAISPEGQARPQ